jgi:hypothetical protein
MRAEEREDEREPRAVREALGALPRMTAPEAAWIGLRRRIEAERARLERRRMLVRRWTMVYAPMATAGAALVAALILRMPAAPVAPVAPPAAPGIAVTLQPVGNIEALVAEHLRLANEGFVAGDEVLLAESVAPPWVTGMDMDR